MCGVATGGAREGGVFQLATRGEGRVVQEARPRQRVGEVGGQPTRLVACPALAQSRLEGARLVGAVEEPQEGDQRRRAHEHALGVAQRVADEQTGVLLVRRRHQVQGTAKRGQGTHRANGTWGGTSDPLLDTWPGRNTRSSMASVTWQCPQCGRRVPNRAEECHCGMTRSAALAAATAAPAASGRAGPALAGPPGKPPGRPPSPPPTASPGGVFPAT